jgi:hypothetical protein
MHSWLHWSKLLLNESPAQQPGSLLQGGIAMTKTIVALAALAAIGFSGAAFAEDATTGAWTTTTGPAAMTDAEMDRAVAGSPQPHLGIGTAVSVGALGGPDTVPGLIIDPGNRPGVVDPGNGVETQLPR